MPFQKHTPQPVPFSAKAQGAPQSVPSQRFISALEGPSQDLRILTGTTTCLVFSQSLRWQQWLPAAVWVPWPHWFLTNTETEMKQAWCNCFSYTFTLNLHSKHIIVSTSTDLCALSLSSPLFLFFLLKHVMLLH